MIAFGDFYRHLQSRRFFRVRRLDSREIAVIHILLRNMIHVLETEFGQRARNKPYTGTVQRRIYQFDVIVPCDGLGRKRQ